MNSRSNRLPVEAATDLEAFSDPSTAPEEIEAWAARLNAVASAELVNRTHRVIRERAVTLEARRRTARSLWIPVAVSSGLLLVVVCAIWSILDEYDVTPNGLPDANQQLLVLLMWCLPISIGVLAAVWFHRAGRTSEGA